VGTCGTALLASIGKSAEAAQVGIVHLLFNVLGAVPRLHHSAVRGLHPRNLPSSPELTGAARLAAETPRQAANAHTVFSVLSTAVLIWFTGPIGKLAQRLAPPAREGWQTLACRDSWTTRWPGCRRWPSPVCSLNWYRWASRSRNWSNIVPRWSWKAIRRSSSR
jgi:hypothetical protein